MTSPSTMRAEIAEGIGMATLDDGIGFRRERAHCRRALRTRENAPGAGQRHPQPIGPMRELVFDFVERLLQQEEVEKTIGGLGRLRPEPRVAQ